MWAIIGVVFLLVAGKAGELAGPAGVILFVVFQVWRWMALKRVAALTAANEAKVEPAKTKTRQLATKVLSDEFNLDPSAAPRPKRFLRGRSKSVCDHSGK